MPQVFNRTMSMTDRGTTVERLRQVESDLLGDDVVVDFPSMAGVIAHMHRSFGADDAGAAHTAQVRLTAREAVSGVRVQLELPVRPTCPVCGGRGEVWSDPCGVCAGSGAGLLRHHLDLRVPAGVRNGARLRFRVSPPFAPVTHVDVHIVIR